MTLPTPLVVYMTVSPVMRLWRSEWMGSADALASVLGVEKGTRRAPVRSPSASASRGGVFWVHVCGRRVRRGDQQVGRCTGVVADRRARVDVRAGRPVDRAIGQECVARDQAAAATAGARVACAHARRLDRDCGAGALDQRT